MVSSLIRNGRLPDAATGYQRLKAADRIASAGMWLVPHMTYARRVRLDGAPLEAADFKQQPEGHTGGSLNMVPAYVAYLALNALDGHTRSWMMGQGHCVAAIDAVNVIVDNMTPAHAQRYGLHDEGLSRLAADFYGFAIGPDGLPATPLGSHVNAHTAGGMLEGGYLGFAELQYVHAPLSGERLVAFLSDGAFEEQRGSDWAPRWWRPQDSGLVSPIMILNGRRIEQRTQVEQEGGESWLYRHLRLNGFRPIGLDGRDPASIAWGIWLMESHHADATTASTTAHNPLHYGIARTIKGYGFPGAGTNRAHNLPLAGNPSLDAAARAEFNNAATRLFVVENALRDAVEVLSTHSAQLRPRERDHPLANRRVAAPVIPAFAPETVGGPVSPMDAIDRHFSGIVAANPALRPRVGNPDELRSNRLDRTLDLLKHRVYEAEPGVAESPTGSVITALNEEAVVCAALANKGGINLVVTYEAFAPKMLGALRQEITFSRQLVRAGRPPDWLGVPVVLTSHVWENSKNEISHQDPTLAEALLGEMADAVSLAFPPDANAAAAALECAYARRGRITALVVPKREVTSVLTWSQATRLAEHGVLLLEGSSATAQVILAATGAYQLELCKRARQRLAERDIESTLIYLSEPARLRAPRDDLEATRVLTDAAIAAFFPSEVPRVLVTHTRPEPFLGALRRIDTGPRTTEALGFINRGGTFDIHGMLFANRTTWAHAVAAVARVLAVSAVGLLSPEELAAVEGRGNPACLR
ncbi:xylulose 5-phosphate 3-epimerase [Lysobacter niastensis]|uniref:Xylulose 5-phosphate 3-epimerase n=2 Tax=Lysobacter niastensis TaxID=380629 RepID=A0ABS0B7I7_9GAMM|nr:xylulose 5-phosphate 3-epimerase [Lysobacter niastensis]